MVTAQMAQGKHKRDTTCLGNYMSVCNPVCNPSPRHSPARRSRGLPQTLPLATLPSPILRRLSRPRGAARGLGPGRSGGGRLARGARKVLSISYPSHLKTVARARLLADRKNKRHFCATTPAVHSQHHPLANTPRPRLFPRAQGSTAAPSEVVEHRSVRYQAADILARGWIGDNTYRRHAFTSRHKLTLQI
jgi:hypothetical protein